MKYLITVIICLSLSYTDKNHCKIIQRYYLHGKLVYEKQADSSNTIKDYGCKTSYLIKGEVLWADSVVTSLK